MRVLHGMSLARSGPALGDVRALLSSPRHHVRLCHHKSRRAPSAALEVPGSGSGTRLASSHFQSSRRPMTFVIPTVTLTHLQLSKWPSASLIRTRTQPLKGTPSRQSSGATCPYSRTATYVLNPPHTAGNASCVKPRMSILQATSRMMHVKPCVPGGLKFDTVQRRP